MTKSALFFDHTKCSGCLMCEMICSLEHFDCTSRSKSHIHIATNNTVGTFVCFLDPECDMCGQCVTICPSEVLRIISSDKIGSFVKEGHPEWIAAPSLSMARA
jgi:Fe-S-cluster-containing dehydrogenase component